MFCTSQHGTAPLLLLYPTEDHFLLGFSVATPTKPSRVRLNKSITRRSKGVGSRGSCPPPSPPPQKRPASNLCRPDRIKKLVSDKSFENPLADPLLRSCRSCRQQYVTTLIVLITFRSEVFFNKVRGTKYNFTLF